MVGVSKSSTVADRQSSIELLKVFAIFLIVISHVTQTLSDTNLYVSYSDYVLNVYIASTDVRVIILSLMRHFGSFANTIFFVCSAWFLVDSKKANYKKILYMLVDIWIVSVIILIMFSLFRKEAIAPILVVKSLLPTTFSNNWYLTYYMLFYAIHPVLNKIIQGTDKRHLLRICLSLSLLYILMNYIINGLFSTSVFATSELVVWITIYFCVAYMKKYLKAASSDKKRNILFVIIGFCGYCGMLLLTNAFLLTPDVSQKYPFLSMSLHSWDNNCSPFFVMAALALFNLARMSDFKCRFVNWFSGLSLLIYITHENILVRSYLRPFLLQFIYTHFGYSHIVLWVLMLAGFFFVCSAGAGVIYKYTLQKLFHYTSDRFYPMLQGTCVKIESCIMNWK